MERQQQLPRAAYSIAEARELLGGCSRSHIYNLRDRGEIRLIKLGRRTLVPADEIRRIVAEASPDAAGSDHAAPDLS